MSIPELQTALVELIDAFAAETGQDVVSVTEAQLALPMEVAFGPGKAAIIAGARPATTLMRTGFEAPLSTLRLRVESTKAGGAP